MLRLLRFSINQWDQEVFELTPSPDPKAIWQTVLATAYQEYTAAKNSDRSHRDGVVVTPVEIVDFQVRALKDSLAAQGTTLADPRVEILDPFGGTGIYCARIMQLSGLTPDELDDLYHYRLRMIEIDPIACQIADANLKTVFEEETGRPPRRSIVICANTFTIPTGMENPNV